MADDTQILNAISDVRSAESMLRDHVERVRHDRPGRFTVHLRLSELRPHNRRPYHIRIASRVFDSLLNAHDVQLYVMSSADLILMCHDVRIDEVDFVIEKVRALFKGDPLARRGGRDRFATWYDLDAEYGEFLDVAEAMEKNAAAIAAMPEDASAGRGQDAAMSGQPLDPMSLAKVDESLTSLRLSDLVQHQSAVIIGADGTERILFDEHFVSIGALQRRVAPGFNLVSDLWLFQHLTESLDKRILAIVARDDFADRDTAISLNLNIGTTQSPEFRVFDERVGEHAERVVVEMQIVDIFADLDMFADARDALRDRGYRILIDGMNPMLLEYFNPGLLEPDYVKVAWDSEFSAAASVEEEAERAEMVDAIGPENFILARTDSESAVSWGLKLGVRRFQGYFIDRLVERQTAKQGRPPAPA
jgi:EAL domain-containing protein (putative c-di-GMP-specific phosphodiesterase class I)